MNKITFLNLLEDHYQVGLIGPLYRKNETNIDLHFPLILVDGGADCLPEHDHQKSFRVGDGDSSQNQMDEVLDPQKSFSDLAYALNIIPQHIQTIWLEGFLGGRRDHEYINLGEVHHFLKGRHSQCICHLGPNIFALTPGKHEVTINGSFSLMLFESAIIKELIGNCQYQLTTPTPIKPLSSHTLSNWGDGKININCDQPFFIFLNPEQEIAPVV